MEILKLSSIQDYANPATTPTSGSLLKAEDVAKILNISTSLAYKLMLSGAIPTVRINRSVRVKSADLNQFINNCWSGWKD